ncbi:MAG: hypothetical protein LBV09_05305 [Deferribacteraceae bacterium]|jgi:thiamine-monophosphate kinase|nr:hypothetical protein [Deferribacteraceae bacterium]
MEFNFIKMLATASKGVGTPHGIGDDAVKYGDGVIAKDIMVEGVHFTCLESLQSIVNRLFISNISDIAAVGGLAGGYSALLAVAIPDYVNKVELAEAICAAATRFDVDIIGGDTTSSKGGLFLSLTIIGKAGNYFIGRDGAKVGDNVYLSRPVGMAKYELERFGRYQQERLPERLLGEEFGRTGEVSACIDISDGLGRDLSHIASASGVKIMIDRELLVNLGRQTPPLHIDCIVSSGEEYALAFTLDKVINGACLIGKVCSGSGVWLDDVEVSDRGYEHI